ncbi:protein MODIFIED TRANSPORT TO THE VACUOLE 1-like isoform X2 [Coffea arabica]|uniref:Protein MODIFIED TRANSPORT TO THE VACUOLE 1-like isoform X2 n=1 Tax=Coffea arabica TaxID=13443 RepID=A0ABM4V5K9_COFAR
MDQSRRAVESYWRSRMIDGATSDEDKVTPVYKLEEICELLRSSHIGIVKEVSEFILKRLQHKSPVVKQKALRLIKYAVGKSGAEFRREMQRNSVAVRQLIHYKGQPDPLKGDALNKAVRETAQEALSALFASEDSKPLPTESLGSRIQGFGNTNFEMATEDKKSFLTEVVNIGSSTIKQGFSSLTQSPSLKKNDTGTYRSPNLRRSLTTETDFEDRYEGVRSHSESQNTSRLSSNAGSGNWSQDVRSSQLDTINADSSPSYEKTHEHRLLETIVTSGGVRLQPTRDAIQIFLVEASKLDALALCHALESKLQSPLWQVLCLLDGEQTGGLGHQEKPLKAEATAVQMPDLIDTGDADDLFGTDDSTKIQNASSTTNISTSSTPLIDNLFGEGMGTDFGVSEQKNDDDPFVDVSFHNSSNKEHEADIFSGMALDSSRIAETHVAVNEIRPELLDIFGPNSEVSQVIDIPNKDVNDIMSTLSISGINSANVKQNGTSWGGQDSTVNPSHQVSSDAFNSILASQTTGTNSDPMFALGATPYNMPPGFVMNPSFTPQQINYTAMASLLAQQQLLASMSNFQQLEKLQPNPGAGSNGSYSSPLPDIFNPAVPNQPTSMMSTSKKEETKAFDFISDHVAAARDQKRVV